MIITNQLITPTEEVSKALETLDLIICTIFLIDFTINLKTKGLNYFIKLGWLDLLGSIPTIDALRAFRLFRVARIFRIFKAGHLLKELSKNKAISSLIINLCVCLITYWNSVILILVSEKSAETANIKTMADAIWWGITTITTVGYGDFYPVTTSGRIIATILMITGIGLFGNLTATIAIKLTPSKQ